jgi:inner membrane protein
MDNLTHTLTGLMLARVGLVKPAQRGGTLALMLAANAPDMDVFWSGFPGGLRYFEHHRGIAHSLILSPLIALVALLLARLIRHASLGWRIYFACWIGVLSHLALDLTNVYGVRLLLPFSSRWFRLDTTDIIDPWIWLILLLALAAPALAGLVSSEIRGRKFTGPQNVGPKFAWACFALIAVLGYDSFRFAAHGRAIAEMRARVYPDTPRFAALPQGIDPLHWRGMVIAPDSVLTTDMNLTEDYDPEAFGHIDYPAQESPAIDAAKSTPVFQAMQKFEQLPFWKDSPVGDARLVELIDLRFGTPQRPGFATAQALVGPDGHVEEAGLASLRP